MEVVAEADSLYEEALTSILANSPLVIYWFVSLLVTIPLKVTTFFLISKLLDASEENGIAAVATATAATEVMNLTVFFIYKLLFNRSLLVICR